MMLFASAWLLGCTPDDPSTTGTVTDPPLAPASRCDTQSAVPDGLHGHNVLIVLLDDIGLEGVGAYGLHPDPPVTPTLDALADEGVRFDHAYATPLCAPSRAVLLTGRYGRRYGFGNNLVWDSEGALPDTEVTLAHVAASTPVPYSTAVFGKWHLAGRDAPDSDRRPEIHGFDYFDVTAGNIDNELVNDGIPNTYFHWERIQGGVVRHVDGYNPTVTVDAALDWIDATPEPWLAYVAMHSAHGPNHVPPADLQGTGVTVDSSDPDLFGAMVEAGDAELGRLLANLPPGARDRTTVIVAGDNGTKLDNIRPPWDIEGAKATFYDAGLHVPMLVTGPLVNRPGTSSDALVHFVDILPTVADIGCRDPDELQRPDGSFVELDGESLVPYLLDPDDPGTRDFVYTEQLGWPGPPPYQSVDKRALVTHEYKLVVDVVAGTESLTALGDSPEHESEDLLALPDPSGTTTSVADALRAQLDAHVANLAYEGPP